MRVGIAQSCVEQATAQAVFAGLGALRPSAQTVQPKLPDTASADDLQTLLQTIAQSNPPKAEVTILVATPAVIANLLKSLNTRNRPLSTGSVMPEGVYALRVNDGAWQVATALSWSRLQTLASDKSSKPSKR